MQKNFNCQKLWQSSFKMSFRESYSNNPFSILAGHLSWQVFFFFNLFSYYPPTPKFSLTFCGWWSGSDPSTCSPWLSQEFIHSFMDHRLDLLGTFQLPGAPLCGPVMRNLGLSFPCCVMLFL